MDDENLDVSMDDEKRFTFMKVLLTGNVAVWLKAQESLIYIRGSTFAHFKTAFKN